MEDCIACTLTYTNKRRVKTVCPECKFECCKDCISKNIKSNGFNCIGCKKMYNPEFIDNLFSINFIKKSYLAYMRKHVIESEMKLMPETKRKLLIEKKREEITKLMEDAIISIGENARPIFEQKMLNISSSCFKDCFYPNCKGVMYRDEDEKYFQCKECNNFGCSECEDACDDINLHECDNEKVEILNTIKKDTTACPNCGERIFKADGCSQIMCSKCKTFFDFNTGLEENKTEPRHAIDFHLLSDKFEISVVGEERYNNFIENIKVCRDWELWDKNKEKNKYFDIIHTNKSIRSTCASIINYKVYLRRIISNSIEARNFNEENRKKLINGICSEEEFYKISIISYFNSYSKLYLIQKLVKHFFQLQEKLHGYVRMHKINSKSMIKVNKKKEEALELEIKRIGEETGEILNAFNTVAIKVETFRYGSYFIR